MIRWSGERLLMVLKCENTDCKKNYKLVRIQVNSADGNTGPINMASKHFHLATVLLNPVEHVEFYNFHAFSS